MRIIASLRTVLFATIAASAVAACTTSGDDGVSDTSEDSSVAGSFDFWQADNGQWYFHVAAGNGATLLTSESYTDRTGAINGALSVMANGGTASSYLLEGSTHGYLLLLRAPNGATIATTEVYSTKSNATRAITSCSNAVNGYNVARAHAVTGARVEVAEGATAQYHFNIHAKNGAVVLTSESYTTAAAAYNGAFAVQDAAAAGPASFELAQATSGTYYFNVRAANHEIVATSQQYTTKASASTAITAVIALLPAIDVF